MVCYRYTGFLRYMVDIRKVFKDYEGMILIISRASTACNMLLKPTTIAKVILSV